MTSKKTLFWIVLILKKCALIFGCGGIYTSSTGVITSPNYPADYNNNSYCEWAITVDSGKTITLIFTDFNIEFGHGGFLPYYYDYVEVRDGAYPFSYLIGQYDGDIIPGTITTTGNSIYVKFVSDESDTYPGFRAIWSACGGTYDSEAGVITSPNYPNLYHNGASQL